MNASTRLLRPRGHRASVRWARSAVALALGLTSCGDDGGPTGPAFVAATFNTGTTTGLAHDSSPDDGYTSLQAMYSDTYYGDGLAWVQVIDDTRAMLLSTSPDVIGFQEIFDPASGCATVPGEARPGFICETWLDGDPSVAQMILGAGYQVACHPGHPDKCVAVKRAFGSFRGCAADLCPDVMTGMGVTGCGSGARVARATIDLVAGGDLVLVNVHGTSGFTAEDEACRIAQIEQVFLDASDGAPAASGTRNLIVGDLNTDPARLIGLDASADRWNDFVAQPGAPAKPFRFVSPIGDEAPASYAGAFNIDHVMSDVATGSCWIAGVTEGHPEVTSTVYFDHHPLVCDVVLDH